MHFLVFRPATSPLSFFRPKDPGQLGAGRRGRHAAQWAEGVAGFVITSTAFRRTEGTRNDKNCTQKASSRQVEQLKTETCMSKDNEIYECGRYYTVRNQR